MTKEKPNFIRVMKTLRPVLEIIRSHMEERGELLTCGKCNAKVKSFKVSEPAFVVNIEDAGPDEIPNMLIELDKCAETEDADSLVLRIVMIPGCPCRGKRAYWEYWRVTQQDVEDCRTSEELIDLCKEREKMTLLACQVAISEAG